MKTLFFTGKGGSGKSTLSAAVAWQLAGRGRRVLAVSFDPAHNLGDVFGVSLSERLHRHGSNLWLREIDLPRAARRYAREQSQLLAETYGYLRPLNLDKHFELLHHSPGLEEHAALVSLEELLGRDSDYDYLVVDTPPTGLTLRVLALPQLTLAWLKRLIALRRSILDKRHTVHSISGHYDRGGTHLAYREEDDRVMRTLHNLRKRFELVRDVLASSETRIAVVFNPDYLSIRESQRLIRGIEELGMTVSDAYHNKVDAEDPDRNSAMEHDVLQGRSKVSLRRVPVMLREPGRGYLFEQDLVRAYEAD